MTELIPSPESGAVRLLPAGAQVVVPALFAGAGDRGAWRYVEFLTAEIRNPNTRAAYARALHRFSDWCQAHHFRLEHLTPVHLAIYVEYLGRRLAKPSVKQHLAAVRMLGDYLVLGQVITANPTASVRGPKYVVKTGKTPVLTRAEARALLEGIDGGRVADLRDRALIGLMVYTFARVGAVLGMDVGDYYQQGKRWWVRLHEKGGKEHAVPCHHKVEGYIDAYLTGAGLAAATTGPLFRRLGRDGQLGAGRLDRREALAMIKRRARAAGLGDRIGCHTFRATGITAYLENGGTLETAMAIAAHESPRTTKLYDRTRDGLTLEEIERIRL